MMNFNIQLFADAQTNTTGTMSVEMKTFYEKRLIDQAEPRLVRSEGRRVGKECMPQCRSRW